jgi:Skp family chaperone for outer membrane proteins
MKTLLRLIPLFMILLLGTRLSAQVDQDKMQKSHRQIEKDKKDSDRLERKINKKQRKIAKDERQLKRKENKRERKIKSIYREEKKIEKLQSDSTRTSFRRKAPTDKG